MRFRLAARRITVAPALALAFALTVAACGSSGSSSATSSSSTPASSAASSSGAGSPAAPSSSSAAGNSAAVAQITTNWEKFFSSSTPVSEKVKLLQNGSALESAINDFSQLPLASNIGAKVSNVTVNSATSATVTYTITSGSSSLLSNQKGTAVNQGGTWKVGDASLCGLLKLIPGGSMPAACGSAG